MASSTRQTTKRKLSPDHNGLRQFHRTYNCMKRSCKWKLDSGRNVEDALYKYGLKLKEDDPVFSFILDTADPNIKQLFTDEEWKEINDTKRKDDIDNDNSAIDRIMVDLCKKTTSGLRDALSKWSDWRFEDYTKKDDYIIDKMCYAMESWLNLFEKQEQPLTRPQSEEWYSYTIWGPFIENILDFIDNIEYKRSIEYGRSEMLVSSNILFPYNLDYAIRRSVGFYEDFRAQVNNSDITIHLLGRMRTMLYRLCNKLAWSSKTADVEVIGFATSGLLITYLAMDHPKGYICRVTRFASCRIPTCISHLSQAVGALNMSIKMKHRIERSIEAVLEQDRVSTESKGRRAAKPCRVPTILEPFYYD
ncbi:hypothetical protein BDB01DRAFT_909472 [Pilobolus umbonatus]|nr:hypothetical protein BDB01DRAFT_909472 [Pilobolus umbonatus]